MIKVEHTPTAHDANSYRIVGDSIDELIEDCLKRIRPQSKEYYRIELCKDLESKGKALIDRHAGMGSFYTVWTQRNYSLTKITEISQELNLDY